MCLGLYLLFCCLFGLICFVLFFSFPAICDIFSIHFSPLLAHNCISLFSVVAVGFTLGIFDLLQSSFKSYTISAVSKTLNNNILPWSLPLFLLHPALLLKIQHTFLTCYMSYL